MPVLSRLLVPLCLATFGVVYFIEAGSIRTLYSQGPLGPDDVPRLFAVALGIVLVIVVIGDLRRPRDEARPVDWRGLGSAALVIVASALYVAAFRPLGFLVATSLYALALLAIFARGRLRIVPTLLQAAGLVAVVYLLFAVLFDVRLPEGPALDAFFSRSAPPETAQ